MSCEMEYIISGQALAQASNAAFAGHLLRIFGGHDFQSSIDPNGNHRTQLEPHSHCLTANMSNRHYWTEGVVPPVAKASETCHSSISRGHGGCEMSRQG
ncbi:hypothetical protein ACLB2K_022119 [Fragaria x ananassa]